MSVLWISGPAAGFRYPAGEFEYWPYGYEAVQGARLGDSWSALHHFVPHRVKGGYFHGARQFPVDHSKIGQASPNPRFP